MYSNLEPIILASASPRRQRYLKEMGLIFTVQTAFVDEQPFADETPEGFVGRMAQEKAAAISRKFPDSWIISGDTVVCLGEAILGKPVDDRDAVTQLMALSGREHYVRTGFCVAHRAGGVSRVQVVSTKVLFAEFSREVALAYVATGESLDKAGSYGIQGKGIFLVKAIEGSYSNVVGLPLYELMAVLLAHKVIQPALLARPERDAFF